MTHKGSCHCKAVEFEIEAPESITVQECNCSICSMTGFLHLIVPKSSFKLLRGKENLTTYRFNTGVAKHTFCKTCGVKAFYTPRSNPDGYSVNLRCLDKSGFKEINIEEFDGQNWEQNASKL
ncbi:MAG: GFA family protein [Candidatus Dadabacteria bacterium]|nr:GFA family protein [Candidatus Dadabacteria bacterium]NIS08428.1 GFA family protein [Candidatus Dadabacteria bacterium]NIV41993.1 GFA family protein [Candidatus Dadabacteria bacterium]NIY21916.1 GFA family protein [Candidatus Dadabacteria bacterium]